MDGLKKIKIKGLFGVIPEHVIELKKEGITFIHGPNGCGKTTCLRLISAIFNWELYVFSEITFDAIEIETNKGKKLKISKQVSGKKPELKFECGRYKYGLSRNVGENIYPGDVEELIPNMVRVGPRIWINKNSGEKIEYSEIIRKYLPFLSKDAKPKWLENFISSIKIHFIKTQRLLKVDYSLENRHRGEEPTISDVIQIYSNEIRELINKKLTEQAAISQLYDRSFPKRLLSKNTNDTLSEDEIRDQYRKTEDKIQKFVNAGLMDKQNSIDLPKKTFEDTERKVLSLYLNDIEQKLAVFDELQNKIEIFLNIVNAKFKTKKISIDKEHGFYIHINNSNNTLSPTQLSSGEQHQIVLFYELIFKTSEKTCFLIDEPEISLHVDWQRKFLEDICKIAQLGDRQFLIATHSPQIIGNRRDLAVALEDGILNG